MDGSIFEGFLQDLGKKGRRDSTVKAYRASLIACAKILEERGIGMDPREIDDEALAVMRDALMGAVKEQTARHYLSIVGRWALYETGSDPVAGSSLLWNHVECDRVFITDEIFHRIMEAAS